MSGDDLRCAARSGAILRLLDRPISAAELDVNAERASRAAGSQRSTTTGLLLFRLDHEVLSIPAKMLRRVTQHARSRSIPHISGAIVRGLCNVRGELVLCADLRALLGFPLPTHDQDARNDVRRMIVIGPADNTWAFEVDALIGIERLDDASMRPPPVTVRYALAGFTAGMADIDGRHVTLLDGERVLAGFTKGLA